MTDRTYMTGEQRRKAIVEFVAGYWQAHSYAPTLREIGDAVGLGTVSGVLYQVEQLVASGVLAQAPKIARSIRVVT